jgi:glutaminyl-peptide cyclotransferase
MKFERLTPKYQLRARARSTSFMPVARACALLASLFLCCACANDSSRSVFLKYEIVAMHPHDAASFTQGLLFHEGKLVESTGGYGHSMIARRDVRSGATEQRHALMPTQFGEGVAGDGRRFVQLTWLSGVAFLYDMALKPAGRFDYLGEGWGLAYDGSQWLMSDGSSRITRRDRDSFAPVGSFEVRYRDRPVARLNELEFVRGYLYANVWHADQVAVIDPGNGAVVNWIDLSALKQRFEKPPGWRPDEHVLNGIAFDPASGHFFVTGKCWPVLFELRVPDAPDKS